MGFGVAPKRQPYPGPSISAHICWSNPDDGVVVLIKICGSSRYNRHAPTSSVRSKKPTRPFLLRPHQSNQTIPGRSIDVTKEAHTGGPRPACAVLSGDDSIRPGTNELLKPRARPSFGPCAGRDTATQRRVQPRPHHRSSFLVGAAATYRVRLDRRAAAHDPRIDRSDPRRHAGARIGRCGVARWLARGRRRLVAVCL